MFGWPSVCDINSSFSATVMWDNILFQIFLHIEAIFDNEKSSNIFKNEKQSSPVNPRVCAAPAPALPIAQLCQNRKLFREKCLLHFLFSTHFCGAFFKCLVPNLTLFIPFWSEARSLGHWCHGLDSINVKKSQSSSSKVAVTQWQKG